MAHDYASNSDWWAYQGFVHDIQEAVPRGDRIFMEDLSGRLALLSGRDFVSGDGLVNSNKYLRRFLIPGQVDQYLAEKNIRYFLTSNIQCPPYRKRMPWTRDVEFEDDRYKFVVDVSYLTHLPIKPSVLYFNAADLVFDKCSLGIRELLFKVSHD